MSNNEVSVEAKLEAVRVLLSEVKEAIKEGNMLLLTMAKRGRAGPQQPHSEPQVVQCTCTFRGANHPMDNKGCKVHTQTMYMCGRCACMNYKPSQDPGPPGPKRCWPVCSCGHISQDHN